MTFQEYLISKKIDLETFRRAEPRLYGEWEKEFKEVHPNSFTSQKLYLINPIRRKYTLKQEPVKVTPKINTVPDHPSAQSQTTVSLSESSFTNAAKPHEKTEIKPIAQPSAKPARPVFKPKPKIG